MPNYTQKTLSDVYAAGIGRGAEFGAALLAELGRRVPDQAKVREWHLRIIDLKRGLQEAAQATDPAVVDTVLGYLQETYGLLDAALDPLAHPALPPLSALGNQLVEVVLNVNGFDVVVNGFLVRLGYVLVPNLNPVYNTTLQPGQTVASVAYNSTFATEFAFDGPVPTQSGTARRLKLFVGTVQVGTIDFPSTLDGQGFSVLYNGNLYYSTFQLTANNELVL